jgi:RNA polymerase sigma-70 factor (ECF subfamily)
VDSSAEARFVEWASSRSRALHRFAFLLCGDWHIAQDLVQEALTKTALHWNRIESVDNPDAYVRRIVINTFHSMQRRPAWRLASRRAATEVSVTDHSVDFAARDALMVALRALPMRQRAAVVLRYYEQLSEAETAVALECSVGTVKSQTSKALQSMRRMMTMEASHADR